MAAALCLADLRSCGGRLFTAEAVLLPDHTLQEVRLLLSDLFTPRTKKAEVKEEEVGLSEAEEEEEVVHQVTCVWKILFSASGPVYGT